MVNSAPAASRAMADGTAGPARLIRWTIMVVAELWLVAASRRPSRALEKASGELAILS